MRFLLTVLLAVLALAIASPAAAATSPLAEDHFTVVTGAGAGPQRKPSVTVAYQVASRGNVGGALEHFRTVVAETLNDPRGWSLNGRVRWVAARRNPDVRIWLASPAEVAAAHPTCAELFSCRVGPDVFINIDRWRHGATGTWKLPLSEYRSYVINHEVGHWLGLDHRDCPGPGDAAPVMQQQTISLQGCEPRTWPLAGELRQAQPHLDELQP